MALRELRGIFVRKLEFDLVANTAQQLSMQVANLADEIEIGGGFRREIQSRARQANGDWNEIFVAPGLEIIHFHGQRKLGERIVERKRILKLALLVARIHLAPHLARVITAPVIELRRFRKRCHLHRYVPILAILRGIGAVISENIVTADVGLHGFDAEREIVAVEQSLSTGIGSQGVNGVLAIVERAAGAGLSGAGEHARAFGRSLCRVAGRRHGH